MARTRPYSLQFNNINVSVVQDLLALYSGAAMACELNGLVLGQITGTAVQNLRLSIKRLPATVTSGAGGNSATPQKLMNGDAAAVATGRVNDTTQATTSGTAQLLHEDVFNIVNGYQFFWPPNLVPIIGLNQAGIVSLDTPPSGLIVMNATLYFSELF